MSRWILSLIAAALLSLAACGVMATDIPEKAEMGAEGTWQGKLETPGGSLRIVLHIAKKADGTYSGTLDSPDQGALGLKLDTVTFKDNKLVAELTVVGGVFEGKMNSDSTQLVGTWSQGGGSLDLTLKRDSTPVTLRRPQEPTRPYPYDEEEVSYKNTKGGNTLGGTLTLPRAKGPFPVVLLITGSGQQNRDEELMGHKPFLVLSDYLTRRGIAVLRVDDRGIGKSDGNFAACTTADFADDVQSGVDFLKARKDIDHTKIGLIGHSEGGVIAPMVAARDKDVAFIVLMAGTGVPGSEVLRVQGDLIRKAMGVSDADIAVQSAANRRIFAIMQQEKDPKVAEPKVREITTQMIASLSEPARKQIGDPAKVIDASIKTYNSPWMRYFLLYDPAVALRQVHCPVLALDGSRDMQVYVKQNFPAIEAALKEAGNKDVTLKELPGLNHLFQTCTTGSPTEYSAIEETIAPVALKTMGDWILEHVQAH